MHNFWKKMLPAFATSLVAFTSTVNAVDDMQMRNLENRVSALEQRRGSNGMINPPARPVVKDGLDFWLEAEALYMHATEDGLSFALGNNNATTFANGHVQNIDYDWNWGVRVGGGFNLPHDGWDVFANWTWFRSHEKEVKGPNPYQFYYATQDYPASSATAGAQASQATGRATLHTNLLDLEMGREFFVSKWLTLRPHIGARGAWLYRRSNIEYKGGSLLATNTQKEIFKNQFHGGGLRGGLDSQWGLGSGFSIYGQAALSLLYGNQKVKYEQDLQALNFALTREAYAKNRWTNVRGITDLGVGVRWDRLFADDSWRVRVQFGWEQHLFFSFHKDMVFTNATSPAVFTSNTGDLAISGVSLQVRFDF